MGLSHGQDAGPQPVTQPLSEAPPRARRMGAFGSVSFLEEKESFLEKARAAFHADPIEESAIRAKLCQELRQELSVASPEALGDRDIALAVLQVDGYRLQSFSPALKDDAEVVKMALRTHRTILPFASQRLRGDKEFVLEQALIDGDVLYGAAHELLEDPEVILAAVKSKGSAMAYASEELTENFEFMLEAATINGWVLEYASPKLRAEKEVVLRAVQSDGTTLKFADEHLRADREVVLEAVKNAGTALSWASEELRADRTIVLEAIRHHGRAIRSACQSLKDDKDFLLLAACNCRDDGWFRAQAGPAIKSLMSWEHFHGASESALAAPGQQAPVLTVTSSKVEREGVETFLFEVSLLSGANFSCELPCENMSDFENNGYGRPTSLADLAAKLVEELPKYSEILDAKRVFLSFGKGEGEFEAITAWDWQRPVIEFF